MKDAMEVDRLVKEYRELEEASQRRCEGIWDDMVGEWQMMKGLTTAELEMIEEIA